METIYLDHNIVHHFVRGFPNGTGPAQIAARERVLRMDPDVRFVVSDWNFLEPCREDKALVGQYGDFLENLNPLFLPTVLAIKQAEMARYVYRRLGLDEGAEVPAFNKVFSQARVASGLEDVLLGYGLKDFMRYLVTTPNAMDQYQKVEQMTLDAQHTIREARDAGKDKDPKLARELWRQWFGSLMPKRGPDKRVLAPKEVQKQLDAFVADPNLVLSACPAIWAESRLADVRANVGSRKPKMQDAIDLMHAVPALAYCDAMVSNDKHLIRCAKDVVKVTGRRMVLSRTLHEAVSSLIP